MPKEISHGTDVKKELLEGICQLGDTVSPALGPKGRNTVLTGKGTPLISSSGFSTAQKLKLENSFGAVGADLMRQVSEKVSETVGDGAATAIVLAQRMIQEGFRMTAAGADPMEMRKGMQGAAQLAAAALKKIAVPVTRSVEIARIAAVAAGDARMGDLIAEAMERVTGDGVITVEESDYGELSLDVTEGMQFDRGYLLPEMATDPEGMAAELDHPYILITDEKIDTVRPILPLLGEVSRSGRPLLILAESVEGEALGTLMVNRERGILNAVAVHPPAYGQGRRAQMEDIALLTGATYFTRENGCFLQDATLQSLGGAASVRVTRNSTVITGGEGSREAIAGRIHSLRTMIRKSEYDFDRRRMEERLARLSGGAAVLRVGAATKTEAAEKKLRAESALHAAKAAGEEGIVPGGGAAYLHIIPAVAAYCRTLTGDRKMGAEIVLRALEEPARRIAANAGMDPDAAAARIRELGPGAGLDVMRGQYGDMMEAGIVDAAKVARVAVQSAASAASVLLTVEAGVREQEHVCTL